MVLKERLYSKYISIVHKYFGYILYRNTSIYKFIFFYFNDDLIIKDKENVFYSTVCLLVVFLFMTSIMLNQTDM